MSEPDSNQPSKVPPAAAHIIDVHIEEWKLFTQEAEGVRWEPELYPDPMSDNHDLAFNPIRDKWVYVVLLKPTANATNYRMGLHAEIYVDSGGMFSVNGPSRVLPYTLEDRPKPTPTNKDTYPLPTHVNGTPAYFILYCSRVRLAKSLFSALSTLVPLQFLEPQLTDSTRDSFSYGLVTTSNGYTAGAVDPITVALNLNQIYRQQHNDLLNYTVTFAEQAPAASKMVEQRLHKLMIADVLHNVLRSDPLDNLDLRSRISPEYHRYRDGVRKAIEIFTIDARNACAMLCRWMDQDFWNSLVKSSHEVDPVKDMPGFLKAYAECCERLTSTEPGRVYLYKQVNDESSVITGYITTEAAGEDVYQVARKSFFAWFTLWVAAAELGAGMRNELQIDKVVRSVGVVWRKDLVVRTRERKVLLARKLSGKLEVTTKLVDVNTITEAQWTSLIADGTNVREFLVHLGVAIEIINLGISINAIFKADGSFDTAWAVVSAFGSALDLFAASRSLVGVWKELPKRTVGRAAAVSAIIDMISAGKDGYAMYGKGDYDAAVGYATIGAGNALIMVGAICAGFGLAADATVVGIPFGTFCEVVGGILVAAGWLIAAFTKRNDLQIFAEYCCFGLNSPQSTNYSAAWAMGPISKWEGDYALQVKAALNLMASFTLQTAINLSLQRTVLRIWTGLVQSNSVVIVNFDSEYNLGYRLRPQLAIDLGARSMRQLDGDPADLRSVRFDEEDGKPYIDVWPDWPDGKHPEKAVEVFKTSCEVRLDMDGGGQNFVPASGKVVPKVVLVLDRGYQDGPEVSSKDF